MISVQDCPRSSIAIFLPLLSLSLSLSLSYFSNLFRPYLNSSTNPAPPLCQANFLAAMLSMERAYFRLQAPPLRPISIIPHGTTRGAAEANFTAFSGPLSKRVSPLLAINWPISACNAIVPCEVDEEEDSGSLPVRILVVVGRGAVSPLKEASWEQVMRHTVSMVPVMTEFRVLVIEL